MPTNVPTAAIISIGDELLRGDTLDTNQHFLCHELTSRGVRVTRCFTIPDVFEQIVEQVRTSAAEYSYVFTGGGIGPTPDDLTRQAVAAAMGRELKLNDEALAEYAKRRRGELNPGQREMCRLPAGCELLWAPISMAPSFRVDNVYVLPGVPKILEAVFSAIANRFAGEAVHTASFKAFSGESNWAHIMAEFVERYPELEFGSYPKMEGRWFAELKVRGRDAHQVERVARELEEHISALGEQPRPGR